MEDAVVGMGLSLLLSALVLVLLDRVGRGTSLENALGVTALTAIPVSLGFSVGVALASVGGVRLGLLIAPSLVLPCLIVFYAEFSGREQRVASDGAT